MPINRKLPGGNRSAFKKIRNSNAANFDFLLGHGPHFITHAWLELSTPRRKRRHLRYRTDSLINDEYLDRSIHAGFARRRRISRP